jgi:POT family proton-dependent oligopeptide transporter
MKKNIATEKEIFGHPVGLFMLFFTEMWERFSYYGMRALLVLYLISEISSDNPGLGWSQSNASELYGWYTMFVYITPIFGGIIADKIIGFRKAIVIGGLLMTLGHLSLAFKPIPAFYLGLILLVLGNGFFKPNISSIVGQLYPDGSNKKDSGYTIFYQGINVGAFLGSILCGYLGETFGWHYGFGLAGIFMLIGLIQFKLSENMFGEIGLAPVKSEKSLDEVKKEPLNKIEKDRLIVVGVLAFFSIFFWAAFEQAGSSMNIFASKHTDRQLVSNMAIILYKIISAILSALPVVILTWLFISMNKAVGKIYSKAITFMGISVLLLWLLIGYMIYNNYLIDNPEVPATWFQSLNALFIFTLAPVFSVIWEKLSKTKINPNGPQKFAIGLILLGIGFIPMVFGSSGLDSEITTKKVSMIFLTLAYLLHTMGELSLSPVGLSYVNKLSPNRLLGIMFGIWFFASAMGNKLAGSLSSYMEKIASESSMSDFFEILVWIPVSGGIILFILSFALKKLMHGID